ncbi:MAG: RidA family protein [Candidatus Dormibacteria bacterium]
MTGGPQGPSRRLAELGIRLPPAAALPPGVKLSYRRLVTSGGTAYLSGHGPMWGDEVRYRGRVGDDVTVADAVEAARLTALSMLRTIHDGLGSIDLVGSWLRVNGYVRAVSGFDETPIVLNGFTDLVRDLWGPECLPSRTAVGVAELPFGFCVEVDAVLELAG